MVKALGSQLEAIRLEVIASNIIHKSEAARKAAELMVVRAKAKSKMDMQSIGDLIDEKVKVVLGMSFLTSFLSTSSCPTHPTSFSSAEVCTVLQ